MQDYIVQLRRKMTTQAWSKIVPLLILVSVVSAATAQEDAWSPPSLSGEAAELPEGRDVVQRVIDFMKTHEQLGFEAIATYEVVQENGQKLLFAMLQRMVLERPRRIYWVTLYDTAATDTAWIQDGTFTMVRQPANLWGQLRVPPTLEDAVSRIAQEYNVPVPFVDMLSGDVAELWLGEDVQWVNYIGEVWVDGQWADHVALRKPEADIQLWFRKGDEPFPIKMVIVHTAEDGLPAFSAQFRQWSTQIPDGAIPKFEPPEGSSKIEIVPVVRP